MILQVGSFKLTGRRVFRMAPVHHHFELAGWNENTVIVRFWIIAGLGTALGMGLFYAEYLSRAPGPLAVPAAAADGPASLEGARVLVAGPGRERHPGGRGRWRGARRARGGRRRAGPRDGGGRRAGPGVRGRGRAPGGRGGGGGGPAPVAAVDLVVTSPGWRPDAPPAPSRRGGGAPGLGGRGAGVAPAGARRPGRPRGGSPSPARTARPRPCGCSPRSWRRTPARSWRRGTWATRCAPPSTGWTGRAGRSSAASPAVLAVELSSFQLHWSATLAPEVAAVLNVAPRPPGLARRGRRLRRRQGPHLVPVGHARGGSPGPTTPPARS